MVRISYIQTHTQFTDREIEMERARTRDTEREGEKQNRKTDKDYSLINRHKVTQVGDNHKYLQQNV